MDKIKSIINNSNNNNNNNVYAAKFLLSAMRCISDILGPNILNDKL